MADAARRLRLRVIAESQPGERLRAAFDDHWPAYRRWMRRSPNVPSETCVQRLRQSMPEIMPTFDALLDAFGGGEQVARFLSLYEPPRLVRGCSQLVIDDDGPVLVRTYDHSPLLFDGLLLRSDWSGAPTLAMTDCLWGALDGVNTAGLAIALAFGGRNVVGPGFGAQLVTRYVLETCETVLDAQATIERIPVYMPYTFVVADAGGDFATIFAGPDRPVRLIKRRASTNLQSLGDWPAYQAQTQSIERLRGIEALLESHPSTSSVIDAFLLPPVWRTEYRKASGSLYVSVYRPRERSLSLHWPSMSESFTLDDVVEREIHVDLDAGVRPGVG